MRQYSSILLAFSLLPLGAFGCGGGENDGVVFADLRWQVRCPDGLGGCSRNGEPHDIFNYNNVEGVRATCSFTDLPDGNRALSFSAAFGGESLTVSSAVIAPAGGVIVSAACGVTITDDSVTYTGQCGSNPPNDSVPCQLSSIALDPNGESGPEVLTTIMCDNIKADVDPTRFIRNVRAPNSRTEAVSVRMINCNNF